MAGETSFTLTFKTVAQLTGLEQLMNAVKNGANSIDRINNSLASGAKETAAQIARQVVSTESLQASVYSLGNTFFFAGTAAFGIYNAVSNVAAEIVKVSTAIYDQTRAIGKEVEEWERLAKAAGSFGDVLKLGEKM